MRPKRLGATQIGYMLENRQKIKVLRAEVEIKSRHGIDFKKDSVYHTNIRLTSGPLKALFKASWTA